MSEFNWLRELVVITDNDIPKLSPTSLGVWPDITDVVICLNRWLILVLGAQPKAQRWKILDLDTGHMFGPIDPVDTICPRSWVEIDPSGFIEFCWYETGDAGRSRYNLATGEVGHFLKDPSAPIPPVTVRNEISFTDVGIHLSLSKAILDYPSLHALPVNQNHTIANIALDGRFIITVELDTHEVKAWYVVADKT
ncbi:MAG: hypothetical protein Fur0044_32610 [Anaerolineae bacterium]